MRFVVRWLFRLLIVGLVLTIGLVLVKDLLLKELLAHRVRRETGLETRIERLEVGLLSPTVTVENLRIYNPPEFGGSLFIHVAECHIEYDRPALLLRRLHLLLFRLNLAEASLVENAAGQVNLEAIRQRFRRKHGETNERRPGFEFGGVDMLNLSLGRLYRVNLAAPGRVQTLNLGVQNEIYTNLDSREDVLFALGRLALKVGLGQLTNQFAVTPDFSSLDARRKSGAAPRPPAAQPPGARK